MHHMVFIPKCRRKALYGQLRSHLGEVLRKQAGQKERRTGASSADCSFDVDELGSFGEPCEYATHFVICLTRCGPKVE